MGLNRKTIGIGWAAAAVITFVCAGLSPWAAINAIAADQGRDVLGFVAGYCLPLTVGTCAATSLLLWSQRNPDRINGLVLAGSIGVIFIVTGLASSYLGLGLAPRFDSVASGPWYVSLPMTALVGYLNAYTPGLLISGLSVGVMGGLHLELWRREPDQAGEDVVELFKPE